MSCTHRARGLRQGLSVAFLALAMAGCSDGGGDDDPVFSAAELNIAGSVGDGPVVNADLSFIDANGVVIGQTTSDDRANYAFVVPAATALPVRVVASGGTDLVTGRPLDFDLVGVLGEDADANGSTLNLSPLSTMTVRALECTGARFSFNELSTMWNLIRGQIGMGLSETLLPNPLFDEIDANNVAAVVFASEALAEVIRRTSQALTNAGFETPPAEVFSKVACDLSVDHQIDGLGADTDPRVSAVYRAASAAVAMEVAAGRLEVDSQVATALLDASIAQIVPAAAGQTVLAVPLSESLQMQMLHDLLFLQNQYEDPDLVDLIYRVRTASTAQLQQSLNDGSLQRSQNSLANLVTSVSLADDSELTALSAGMARQVAQAAPFISLFSSQNRVLDGESVTFSWATSEATRCTATGGWGGAKALSGSETLAAPLVSGDYALTCMSLGGINTASVNLTVLDSNGDAIAAPTPAGGSDGEQPNSEQPVAQTPVNRQPGEPAANALDVSLSASRTAVSAGEAVTLSWTSTNAQSCRAAGAWSGAKSLSGSLQTGPVNGNSRYELVCTAANQTSSAIVLVQVTEQGTLNLEWELPTDSADGGAIASLSRFKIYYGINPGQYTEQFTVEDPTATSVQLAAAPSSYYVVMTAIDADGAESAYSNEIIEISR